MRSRLIPWFLALGMIPAVVAQPPGTFTPIAGMTAERIWHTATLLTTGEVLIAGGQSGSDSPLSIAELYDPATGTFAATGVMVTPRLSHTATLLPSGKVLITGGLSSGEPVGSVLASAELYDPATGTFAATSDMTTARNYHTATLLNNGKVLIAGDKEATGGGDLLASAELYDPATGTFTTAGDMNTSRDLHTATLLSNGKVLIQGSGEGKFFPGLPAELYDPDTGTFTFTSRTINIQFSDTATLLPNGKVLDHFR